MMQLEMYLDGELVDTATVCIPLLRRADYLKGLMVKLEKKYAPVLLKFPVKPVYALNGVQSRINCFVPLCPSEVSQLENTPAAVKHSDKLKALPLQKEEPKTAEVTSSGNSIHPPSVTAA